MAEKTEAKPIVRTGFELRPTGGGPPIRGDLRVEKGAKPRSAVVICHGFKGFRAFGTWPHLARALAARGHAAVTFDFSHNGMAEGDVDTFSALHLFREQTHARNVEEIRMVIDALVGGALLKRAPRHIGLLGHSRGGGEALLAATEDRRVDALVTWAGIGNIAARWTPEQVEAWRRGEDVAIENTRTKQPMPVGPAYWADVEANGARYDLARAAAELTIPWLIVHGDADETVPVSEAHALYDAAGDNAELLVVEGADHGFGARHPWAGATPELRTVAEATVEWFDENLA